MSVAPDTAAGRLGGALALREHLRELGGEGHGPAPGGDQAEVETRPCRARVDSREKLGSGREQTRGDARRGRAREGRRKDGRDRLRVGHEAMVRADGPDVNTDGPKKKTGRCPGAIDR